MAADQQIWIHEDGSLELGEAFPSHFLPMPDQAEEDDENSDQTDSGNPTDTGLDE